MKKQYMTPAVKVVAVEASDIICTSMGFGDGSTNTMNARDFDNGLDDLDLGDDLSWDE